jgi:hypothetical protein
MSDNRLAGSHMTVLAIVRSLCAKHSLTNMVLVMTMGDEVAEDVRRFRESQLQKEFRKTFQSGKRGGASIADYDGTFDSAWQIINLFRSKPTCDINLQPEMLSEERRESQKAIQAAVSKCPVECWQDIKVKLSDIQ